MRALLALILGAVLITDPVLADDSLPVVALGLEAGVAHEQSTTFPMFGVWVSKYAETTQYAFSVVLGGDSPGVSLPRLTVTSNSKQTKDNPNPSVSDPEQAYYRAAGKSFEYGGIDAMATFKIGGRVWLRAGGGIGQSSEYDDFLGPTGTAYSIKVDSGIYARGRLGLGTASSWDDLAAHVDILTHPLSILAGAGIRF